MGSALERMGRLSGDARRDEAPDATDAHDGVAHTFGSMPSLAPATSAGAHSWICASGITVGD